MKKTLDEVIKAYEICMSDESKTTNCMGCPYADATGDPLCFGEDKEDALHYLKEYKERQEMLSYWSEKAISEQQNIADAYMLYKIALEKEKDNLPLTWDELKTMEGKPVWIEMHRKGYQPWSGWEVIDYDGVNDSWMSTYRDDYARFQMGEEWQAYRKERS